MVKTTKTFFCFQSLALTGTFAFSIGSPFLLANAEVKTLHSIPLNWYSHKSPDFSEDGRPKRTAGGASRSECQTKNDFPLTALIPDTPVALTAAVSPTFWFYIPYSLSSEHSVEFVLKDNNNQYVYQTRLTAEKASPGIVGLRLPTNVKIDAKRDYNWYFLVYCKPQNLEKFVYVNGSLRRLKFPSLNISLDLSLPEEKLHFFATEQLWYDAVTHLAKQMKADPQDIAIQNDWITLLQSVGLEELASEPFIDCCLLNSN